MITAFIPWRITWINTRVASSHSLRVCIIRLINFRIIPPPSLLMFKVDLIVLRLHLPPSMSRWWSTCVRSFLYHLYNLGHHLEILLSFFTLPKGETFYRLFKRVFRLTQHAYHTHFTSFGHILTLNMLHYILFTL